jgi:hypothetical protein
MRRFALAAALLLAVLVLSTVAYVAAASRAPAAPSGRQQIAAPIDQVDVLIRESNPPQVTVKIAAGLPSGCAQRDSYSVSRTGDTITVSVLNTMPKDDLLCTAIYGTYELNVDLGSSFTVGTTYTVRVNDKTTTFKA